MRSDRAVPRSRPVIVQQRRRRFGLDAPRVPDVGRIERDILAWLKAKVPDAMPLRAADSGSAGLLGPNVAAQSATLVLLLPCRRTSILRIEAWPDRPRPGTLRLAEACVRRDVPVAVVSTLDETRAALRRWGFEPEGN